MSLSANVEALLEVYSKCLGLLHVFGDSKKQKKKKKNTGAGAAASHHPSDWDQQSRLSRSLHADRAKVKKVFSSRLSETGTRLAKGDTRSRSALRRIVDRLTSVLSTIVSLTTRGTYVGQPDGPPLLHYDALRALSNSSRVGAIHAIDDLSVRLKQRAESRAGSRRGQSARLRKATPSTVATSNKAVSSKRASSHSPPAAVPSRTSPSRAPPRVPPVSAVQKSKSSSHGASSRANIGTNISRKHRKQDKTARASTRPKSKDKGKKTSRPSSAESHASEQVPPEYCVAVGDSRSTSGSTTTSTARAGPLHDGVHLDSRSKPRHSARPLSMLSSSSASTRLGEIPKHKLHRRHMKPEAQDGSVQDLPEYYGIRPAYPMRPLWMPDDSQADPKGKEKEKEKEKEKKPDDKKKRFWGRGRP